MPSRGGMAGLSDVEIKAAVSYMVSRVNVPRQN
jgi:cytochrome c5